MSAEKQPYKYRREDFGELPVDLHHLTIRLNFIEERVEASNCLEMTARHDLDSIELDARDLTILRVEGCNGRDDAEGEGVALDFRYETKRNKLVVTLPRRVRTGEKFLVRTLTVCVPSDHILEGIYKDTTPPGAPQQYISQCQQWGFQRIMPIFDDCSAKCTMTTTLEADARYTHLISNGNISRTSQPGRQTRARSPAIPAARSSPTKTPFPWRPISSSSAAGTWDMLVDAGDL